MAEHVLQCTIYSWTCGTVRNMRVAASREEGNRSVEVKKTSFECHEHFSETRPMPMTHFILVGVVVPIIGESIS